MTAVSTIDELRIGYITSSVSRIAGGLFTSVRELARAVNITGARAVVFAAKDEYTNIDLPAWDGIDVRLFERAGPAAFGYTTGLNAALRSADLSVVHTQGIWMYPSVAALKWGATTGRPHVISPRGMLDQWALNNSQFKKKIALAAFERRHLNRAAFLHALNEAEAESFRAFGLKNPIVIIQNGITALSAPCNEIGSTSYKLVFIGRIHPKKGLFAFLNAWAEVKWKRGNCPWKLIIAGWDQGGHERELLDLAIKRGVIDSIEFVGPKYGAEKEALLRDATAIVLPSQSEGMPMAVLEAWAMGIPALITRECNLVEGFHEGAAIELPLEHDGMKTILERFLDYPPSVLRRMGECGRNLACRQYAWPVLARRMVDAYKEAVNKSAGVY